MENGLDSRSFYRPNNPKVVDTLLRKTECCWPLLRETKWWYYMSWWFCWLLADLPLSEIAIWCKMVNCW